MKPSIPILWRRAASFTFVLLTAHILPGGAVFSIFD